MGQEMLRALGYQVTGIRNSLEALDTFQKNPSLFDLIITDMTMPQNDGHRSFAPSPSDPQ